MNTEVIGSFTTARFFACLFFLRFNARIISGTLRVPTLLLYSSFTSSLQNPVQFRR